MPADSELNSAPTRSADFHPASRVRSNSIYSESRAADYDRRVTTPKQTAGTWAIIATIIVFLAIPIAAASVCLCVFYLLIAGPVVWKLGHVAWNCKPDPTPIRVFCIACGKYIGGDIEWVCGYCDSRNADTNAHSFLNCCAHCGNAPPGMECQHCGTILGDSTNLGKLARSANSPFSKQSIEAARDRWTLEDEERKRSIQRLNDANEIKTREKRLEKLVEARDSDPIREGVRSMLEALAGEAAKRDALRDYAKKRVDEIRDMELPEEEETRELEELEELIQEAKARYLQ
jgi:hypothetical protein